MSNFKDNIDLFVTEQIEDSIRDLRKTDKQHDFMCKSHAQASEKYEEIVSDLGNENKEFLEKFKDEIYMIEGKVQKWLYLQGYKDCMKLLKLIKAT